MAKLVRTFEIEDISPEELADIFASMFADEQAKFFARVWEVAKDWPGAGWCQQSCAINEKLSPAGRDAITTLAAHVLEPVA